MASDIVIQTLHDHRCSRSPLALGECSLGSSCAWFKHIPDETATCCLLTRIWLATLCRVCWSVFNFLWFPDSFTSGSLTDASFFFFCNFCSSCLIARNTKKKWFDHEASLLLALLWHASWFKTQLAHTTSPSTNCRPIAQSYLLDLQDFARTLASFFATTWLSLFFHPSWDFDPIWSIWLLCASMWVRPTKLKPYQCILQFLPVPSNSIPYATQRPEPMGR